MLILAVDPGIRGVGVALFRDLRRQSASLACTQPDLVRCAYVRNPSTAGAGPFECSEIAIAVDDWLRGVIVNMTLARLDGVVVEWPQVYTAGKLVGDPNDLLPLAGVDAAIVAYARAGRRPHVPRLHVIAYKPHEWKGQIPKGEIFEGRVRERLTLDEAILLDDALDDAPKSLRHNVYDAVIGLHYAGRFERRRTFAR
jgi:hypothetical protein